MNWKRWIRPGLVATLVMAVIAVAVRNGAIGRDIAGRVTAELAGEGLGWATAEVSARDVTIRGMAPSTEAQEAAVATAGRVAGVRGVRNGADLLPIISPYVWTARRDGRSVTLSGSVPSEGARAAVLAAARRAIPEAEIRDAMALGRGAPASFNSAATFSLARLATLSDGMVTLTDSTLAISGTAANAQAYADARTAFAELPAAINLGPVDLLPARADPFVFSATFDGKAVTLVGFVPNEIVRKTLVASTKATLPGVPIRDTVAIASGDPPGFAEAASFAIAALDRMHDGGVTLDGLNLDVAGTAKSVDDYAALLANLSGDLPQGMKIVSAAIAPAVASPYGWRAEKTDGAVVLSGYVPSAADADEVAATARIVFAGASIDDRVQVAAGEPQMDWIGAIKFAMGELARLGRGKVEVGDKSYAIEGEAISAAAYGEILDANGKTLPASLALIRGAVTAPRVTPFRFAAERRAGGGIEMSGYVPDEAGRDALFAAAHRKFGAVEIAGDLAFASGAPDGFVDAANLALQVLSRIAGGRVEVVDNSVSAEGLVYQPGAVGDIFDELASGLPEGFSADATSVEARQDDQPVTAQECRDMLQAVLQSGHIAFDGTQAEIATDSIGVLDRVSAAMARCPDANVEVGAHSDSEGSTARNRDRTQARADAIVDFLVSAGIRRERLMAVGYGEKNPIADNSTDEGKAANRRIEFSVALPDGG